MALVCSFLANLQSRHQKKIISRQIRGQRRSQLVQGGQKASEQFRGTRRYIYIMQNNDESPLPQKMSPSLFCWTAEARKIIRRYKTEKSGHRMLWDFWSAIEWPEFWGHDAESSASVGVWPPGTTAQTSSWQGPRGQESFPGQNQHKEFLSRKCLCSFIVYYIKKIILKQLSNLRKKWRLQQSFV